LACASPLPVTYAKASCERKVHAATRGALQSALSAPQHCLGRKPVLGCRVSVEDLAAVLQCERDGDPVDDCAIKAAHQQAGPAVRVDHHVGRGRLDAGAACRALDGGQVLERVALGHEPSDTTPVGLAPRATTRCRAKASRTSSSSSRRTVGLPASSA
jgi:hypothetical protein